MSRLKMAGVFLCYSVVPQFLTFIIVQYIDTVDRKGYKLVTSPTRVTDTFDTGDFQTLVYSQR